MGRELLLEIGTEEIPAGFISPALEGMRKLLHAELDEYRIRADTIITMGTPRRLVLCAQGVEERQKDTVMEIMGPPEKVAFDQYGNPTKAAEGFALRNGVSLSDLKIVVTKRGNYVQVTKKIEGKETVSLLPEILQKVIFAVPFPKSMRWADGEVRFARPIKWILTIFNGEIVPFSIEDIKSSNESWGHRFLSNKSFIVHDLKSYLQQTEAHFVIPKIENRKTIIQQDARKLAGEIGGKVLEDPELLDTVANLVEYPVTLRGGFSSEFLTLPRDVLICSMKEHQKYFAVVDANENLLPYFIVVSNNRVQDSTLVIKGNERVLSARLTDSRFFFEKDRKITLSQRVPELHKVVYQATLGSMYDKVSRLRELGHYLAQRLNGELLEKIERAAYLCKADLLTEMVGEFPMLQGIMGREYALLDGESPEVAEAIYEHYLPTSGKGKLPATVIGSLLSLADKVDNLVGCFGIGLIPTGTADPHALRRQALGMINIILEKAFPVDLPGLIGRSLELFGARLTRSPDHAGKEVLEFIRIRFHHQLTAQRYDYDVVEAITTTRFANLVDVFDRIRALQTEKARPEFKPLAITFKRVANIVASHTFNHVDPALLMEKAEKNFYDSYRSVEGKVHQFIKVSDYPAALAQLAMLKPSVDTFFDETLVMCEDKILKENRLGLLNKVSALFQSVADFAKIVTEG